MERYLIKYLRDCESIDNKKKIDYFKIELDRYIYKYGHSHISSPKISISNIIYRLFQYTSALSRLKIKDSNNILTTVYFANASLWETQGYNVYSSILAPVGYNNVIGDYYTVKTCIKINSYFKSGKFNLFYDWIRQGEIDNLKEYLLKQYKQYNFKGLFLHTDQLFQTKLLIDIFKELQRPSLIFSHGLPGIYSKDVDNRSDYLLVWGEKIKDNYVQAGFNPDKIKVVGNLRYNDLSMVKNLKNSLDNILVIPISSIITHQDEWDNVRLVDRSMILLYLYQVQYVLKKFNVKKVRYRPHPTIDAHWVHSFLDNTFYEIDNKPLKLSLSESSLVIGATSSVFIDAISNGVNYLIYEPKDSSNSSLTRGKLVSPFNGDNSQIKVATDEIQLENLIRDHYSVNPSAVKSYIQPLDLSILRTIIK